MDVVLELRLALESDTPFATRTWCSRSSWVPRHFRITSCLQDQSATQRRWCFKFLSWFFSKMRLFNFQWCLGARCTRAETADRDTLPYTNWL